MNKQILVADDDNEIYILIKSYLQNMNVEYAHNYNELEDKIENKSYDLLLLDLHFGEEDGLDLINFYHNEKLFNKHRTILITYDPSELMAIKSHKIGVLDFINKPLKPALFKSLIEKHLNHQTTAKDNLTNYLTEEELRKLTLKEREIINILATHPGRNYSFDEIVGHFDSKNYRYKTLQMHISSIRKKLPNLKINNIRGFGYSLNLK